MTITIIVNITININSSVVYGKDIGLEIINPDANEKISGIEGN